MSFIADLHIHSKYSRATSRDADIENLNKWAKIKGVKVLGTGDFTHPLWLKELKHKLEPTEPGLFKLKKIKKSSILDNDWLPNHNSNNEDNSPRFLLTSEISCVYSKNNRVRKIHILVLAPDFQTVEKINTRLSWIGNLKSDGRPILGLDAKELLKIVLSISDECMIIPAHMYTPWFSLFGSMSGFDSLEECFEEYSQYVYAGETGLSSDPSHSWQNSSLDKITLISNSDAHSPQKIGREANVFDSNLSYRGITRAIRERNPERFLETIEFFPEEGKYHYDGHRNCHVSLEPKQTRKLKNICPQCGRNLTIGVLHRIEDLANRKKGEKPSLAIPFRKIIPLGEIIAEAKGVGAGSKTVNEEYKNLIRRFGNEMKILLETGKKEIEEVSSAEIAEGIDRVKKGKVRIEPGYDGEFGKVVIFEDKERKNFSHQVSLF